MIYWIGMNENNLKDRMKEAKEQTKRVFKAYIVGILLVYVAGSIMASQHIIEVDQNQLLMGSAVIIGIAVVLFQMFVTYKARQEKKLAQ